MKPDLDIRPQPRPIRPALLRGWRCRCPNCGGGKLYSGYLRAAQRCMACGERLDLHKADDMPAWATIMIVGHVVASLCLAAFQLNVLPLWAHSLIWPTVALALTLLLLPRIKGMVVAWQWSSRMHGFGDVEPRDTSS